MSFFKSRAVKELDALIRELQLNLENNYKDTARAARDRLGTRLEEMRASGALSDKDYKKYFSIYNAYCVKMTGYHH